MGLRALYFDKDDNLIESKPMPFRGEEGFWGELEEETQGKIKETQNEPQKVVNE